MVELSDSVAGFESPNFKPRIVGICALVALIIIGGFMLVTRFTAIDYARDAQSWREKLSLVAESRAADVGHFVSEHFKELRTLADNPSLRLYLSELQMTSNTADAKSKKPVGDAPQKTYLRNLLLFTADRSGFSDTALTDGIPANVPTNNKNGLVVLNNNDEMVVSTPMAEPALARILQSVKNEEKGQERFIDIQKDEEGTLYIGFSVPIYSIQGDHTAASQIGKVVALKTIDMNFFNLLKTPGSTDPSLETLLLRSSGEGRNLEYISPLEDGTSSLSRQSPLESDSAEANLLKTPGSFLIDKKDYADAKVVATSRAVAGTPWSVVVKVDSKEAFAESAAHRTNMVTFFILIIAVIVLTIIAVWWYAHSHHAFLASNYFKKLAAQAQAQEHLLRLVADNQPEPIYIVDEQQRFWFANAQLADSTDMSAPSIIGKTISDVRGAARATQAALQSEHALKLGQIVFDSQRLQVNGKEKIIRSAYVPLEQIPVSTLPAGTRGVLVVEQDVSDVIHEREERLATQRQLVHTLVKLVDKRDPFAANHSMLVAQVAYEMAMDMEIDGTTIDTTRTAANLMNIGKIVIPTELLTKTGELSEPEKIAIRDSMNAAADLVKDIAFDGPVADTLRQWQEKWDGSGPLGKKGEEILISARIIAVANAFIGMISPRSWRNAMPIDAANKFLLEQADSYFDRKVVISLINYVENHSGRAWLKQVIDNQKNVA